MAVPTGTWQGRRISVSLQLLLALRALARVYVIELVVCPVIAALFVVLVVERDDVDDGLWMFLLLLLGDSVGL